MVSTRKTAPTHLVARASLASQVLALLRDRKESATPPMAPERPALLPDWNREAGTLAGLEQDHHDDGQTAEQLQDRNDKR